MELSIILIIAIVTLAAANIITTLVILRRTKALQASQQSHKDDQPTLEITPEYMAELEAKTKATFTKVIDDNARLLNQSVAGAIEKLNGEVDHLTGSVITEQIADYQTTLSSAKDKIIKDIEELSARAQARQQELDSALEAQMKERRAKVAAKLDQSLSEIVISYIAESFGPGVDFNSQKSYVFKSLEDHKEELKKDILNGG